MSDIIFLFLRRLRMPLGVLIIVYSIAITGMTLAPGIDADGNPWRMSFFHAFYFVSFMGTTIGFGEIPHAFTDEQRLWVTVCVYASVIAWLYAIGNVLRLFQDASFQQAVSARTFRKAVRRVGQDFYVVCGYGDTGRLLTRGLTDLNILAIVVDLKSDLLGSIELSELSPLPITLCGDITDPETLISAGVNHLNCKGVIAVTEDEHTNLEIAVAVKLINAKVKVICRSESDDETRNMRSFGTDHIINPFETFANRLGLLTHEHTKHRLQSWFVNQHSKESINLEIAENGLPSGLWIICGYGRLGQSIVSTIQDKAQQTDDTIEIIIIDPKFEEGTIEENGIAYTTIQGRGTEAETLRLAGIERASIVVAASDDDANNLSILITARDINAQIYSIGRVNDESKHSLYKRVKCDYIMRRSQLVSNEVLTLVSRPLVSRFLSEISDLDPPTTEILIDQIEEISTDSLPVTWRLTLTEEFSPALMRIIEEQHTLRVSDVVESLDVSDQTPRKKLTELALMLYSGDSSNNKGISHTKREGQRQLLPSGDQELKAGDQLLICHAKGNTCRAQKMAYDYEKVDSRIGGNNHYIPLLRWLHRRERTKMINDAATVISVKNEAEDMVENSLPNTAQDISKNTTD